MIGASRMIKTYLNANSLRKIGRLSALKEYSKRLFETYASVQFVGGGGGVLGVAVVPPIQL